MLDTGVTSEQDGGDFVVLHETGANAKGEFHCSECGYGVAVHRKLPVCPMCSGTSWEPALWSPFTRSATTLL